MMAQCNNALCGVVNQDTLRRLPALANLPGSGQTQDITLPFRQHQRHQNFFDTVDQAQGDREPQPGFAAEAKQPDGRYQQRESPEFGGVGVEAGQPLKLDQARGE